MSSTTTPATVGRMANTIVSLDKVKAAISPRGLFKLSQRAFDRKHNVDQGHLSRMLNGTSNVESDVVVFSPEFERAFLQECLDCSVTIDQFAAPLGAEGEAPDFQGIASAMPSPPVVDPTEFPMGKMQLVAKIIRDGATGGEVSMTFSLRALIRCSQAYTILTKDAGLKHWPALSVSLWLTKVYGADDEGRRFLKEAYQRIFAKDLQDPMGLIPHRPDQHPSEVLVKLLAQRGFPVWSFGKTGEGKTYANLRIAKELSSTGNYHRFQGDRDKTATDFIGDLGAKDGTTYRVDGPLTTARRMGEPIVVDEVCICDPSVLMCLQAVLEGNDLTITGSYHEVVAMLEGFLVLVTDNSRGLGESVEYVGTQAINEATRDRFYFVEFGSMDPKQELAIAESEAALELPPVINAPLATQEESGENEPESLTQDAREKSDDENDPVSHKGTEDAVDGSSEAAPIMEDPNGQF